MKTDDFSKTPQFPKIPEGSRKVTRKQKLEIKRRPQKPAKPEDPRSCPEDAPEAQMGVLKVFSFPFLSVLGGLGGPVYFSLDLLQWHRTLLKAYQWHVKPKP